MLLKTHMSLFLLLNTKEDHLKNVGYQTVDSPHWLPWIFFPSVEVNGCRQLSDYQHSSKYNLAVFKRKKKDTRTGLEQLEGEW